MTAVSVQFDYTWLTDPVTNASVTGSVPARTGASALGGSFRSYAGGRTRIITSSADVRTYPLVIQGLDDAGLALLDSWRGRTVLLRDSAGLRVWGSFLDLTWNDFPGPSVIHDVTLVFRAISYSEAV